MHLEFFIAKRLYRGRSKKGGTAPIIRLSVIGVALSLMVMLLAIAISAGFKRGVVNEVLYAATGHISIHKYLARGAAFEANAGLKKQIASVPGVTNVAPILEMVSLLKTDSAYRGIMLCGVDRDFDSSYFRMSLASGRLPLFSAEDTVRNPILLSKSLATELDLKLGDKVVSYFMDGKLRLRSFTLVGIYRGGGGSGSQSLALVPIETLQRVSKLDSAACSTLAISVDDPKNSLKTLERISAALNNSVHIGDQRLSIHTAEELNPAIIDWLSMLDSNVMLLLVLMGLVAAFTMIATLIVLVMENTQFIGTLKALGAQESCLRKSFLYLALMLMLRGLLWGNLLAGILCFVQYKWRPLSILDPEIYFIDYVPISFDAWAWILVNLGTIVLILLMLVGPTHIISRIRPAKAIRFE